MISNDYNLTAIKRQMKTLPVTHLCSEIGADTLIRTLKILRKQHTNWCIIILTGKWMKISPHAKHMDIFVSLIHKILATLLTVSEVGDESALKNGSSVNGIF